LTGDIADNSVRGSRLVLDSLLRHGNLRRFWQDLVLYLRLSSDGLRRILPLYCLLPLLPTGLQKQFTVPWMRRVLEGARPNLLPGWMPEPLRAELAQRHIDLSLERERGRRFANWTRAIEYRALYPAEIPRNPVGWPLDVLRPYADRRLHEYLLAIPPEVKFAPHPETNNDYAAQKQIVRRAMKGIQPESVRNKLIPTHYGSVFADEVKKRWRLYEDVFGPSGRSEVAARGYIDQGRFWKRLEELRAGDGYGKDFIYVTRIAALETWLRSFTLPRPARVTVPPFWGNRPLAIDIDERVLAPAGSA